MCGIIGYVGRKEAVPILIDSLKRLEYRGYDSSGVGVISLKDQTIEVRKTEGKIHNLEGLMKFHPLPSANVGISHTRWATHGIPNKINSHPHSDHSGKILVVHNGIIENYQELKKYLTQKGHRFLSQTDTEVIPHLIAEYDQGDFLSAVARAVNRLKGAFAVGIIHSDYPDTLMAARVGSPLIIGIGKDENFIASDVPAILDKTKRVIYLKDGQIALIKKEGVRLFNFFKQEVKAKIDTVSFKVGSARKEGYPHFMLKEIYEQPKVLTRMLTERIKGVNIHLEGLNFKENELRKLQSIVIVACGTAYHAGMIGKYVIEKFSRLPVTVDVSSEFRYRDLIVTKKTLVIAISQSGETADTLAAVREAKTRGATVISICNVLGSSLSRESRGVLYTHAGPEIGVASTKAYTAQLCMLYLFALKLGTIRKAIESNEAKKIIKDLKRIPFLYTKILNHPRPIARIGRENAHFGCFLFLGRNINFPSALEGALKLKEISYIPAEGYAAGEMKHGPIALIDEYRAVVCIAPQSDTYEKMVSNMEEIKSRKGKIIAIATQGDKTIAQHCHHAIFIPSTHPVLTPFLVALPLQLLAYYISTKRGCDVDQPRNLAKSVTVE